MLYNKKYGDKTKLFTILGLLLLFILCYTNIIKHNIIFADKFTSAITLNSMSIDEIVAKEIYTVAIITL